MSEQALMTLRVCVEEYDEAALQALVEDLSYVQVIEAITAALLGEWDDCPLH